ncbi:MAG: SdrD B-like domain-containing protein, partial [Trichodesmium sp. MO_231.B1]|nr:SdrD B-like domain-containing protein [Trichodesmium sp. MO_231.B1]
NDNGALNGLDQTADPDSNLDNGSMVELDPGENDLDQDFGYDAPTGSIGDTIFRDDNADGDQDDGEAGISGVEVRLTDKGEDGQFGTADDEVIGTKTTDANGKYLFEDLEAGNYQVEVLNDNGALNGLDQTADPDSNLDNGSMVELDPGENDLDQDFGYDAPENPGIEIEKSTNTVDADTPDLAPEIVAGETVTWTYEVTNTGDVSFDESEVVVTDDQEGTITNIVDKINGDDDNTLEPGETWIYEQTGIAQDLSTATNTVIDFETDAEGNPLDAGTVIDTEYSALGLTISATGGSNQAMIFDSANPTGGDSDLATDSEGNILIISEDGDSSDPDDEAHGGVITFDLDNPVELNSINFVDIEETGGEVRTTDVDGNVTTTAIPAPGDGSLQTLDIDDSDVVKVEVDLVGSGAISGLDFDSIGDGIYKNIGTVVADGVEDSDPSHYVNGEPDPQNPGIDIEKFTNGVDADTIEEAVKIAAGETVTWTYEVTNTGDVPFDISEIEITDDQEGTITNISNQGDGDDTLAPNETWIYEQTGIAQDLSTATSSQDFTFNFTGNSYTTGSHGNVRTFTQNGVSVDVSAFSSNKSGGNWKTAYLGVYNGALGVTNRNESGSHHRVDNGTSNDYILFEFDKEVTVDRAFLSSISKDSDISVWIGDRDGDISLLNSDILNDFTKENKNGGNGGSDKARWANFNADELTGDTLVIAAKTNDNKDNDAFKVKKLDLSVAGDTTIGNYVNIGTVTAGSVSDQDQSSYTNPEGELEPENPGIEIEKSTNGVDADTPDLAPEIAAGETVTWTYEVTNTGNVSFDIDDIEVTDDQEGTITHISHQGDGDDTLAPGETWIYQETGTAQDLTTTTSSQDITFHLTGNSYTTGSDGNVRTFTQNGVSVDVSAFSSNKSGGDWKKAYLGAYGGGLGVTNQNEGGSGHRVDNGGSNDYILFEFDEEVIVDRAFLDYVSGGSDITVWIGDRDGEDISLLNNDILNDFTKENNDDYNNNHDRWADFNANELKGDTLVIAARTDHNHDAFKLRKLDISVPGEESSGVYENIGTVSVNGLIDEDWSHYVNPDFSI